MEQMQQDRYIENLHTVRELAKPQIEVGMTAQEVLDRIQQNAARSYQLMQENNRLLQELVFSRRAEELTDADIQELEAFSGRLFAYANSEDNGIAYKIHELLLHTALLRQDAPFIIRELYNCGVTLHYLNIRDEEYKLNAFGDQARAYFEKAMDYLPRYEEFDSKTRGYLIRCLGNCKMSINRNDPKNSRIYLSVFEQALGIMNDPYYQKLDPEIPWKSFIYTMHMDQLSLLPYLRHCEDPDPEIARKVWESAEYVERYRQENKSEEERVQNWRAIYFYWAAKYHAGHCTIREAVEKMLEQIARVDPDDYSADGVNNNLGLPSHVFHYMQLLSPQDMEELGDCIRSIQRRCIRYLDRMPVIRYPRAVSMAVWDLAEAQPYLNDWARTGMLQYLLASHKPTYVHSLMVAHLTQVCLARLLETRPETLIGLAGYQTVEELQQHAADLCTMAYECGLYHDIGKNSVTMYIGINARRLLDEEFACIQLHPAFGYHLLAACGHEKDLAQAALFHHRFYDGSGGYPKEYGSCRPEMKAIVDILNVADSLDAATDNVGRCYTVAKPLETLLEEFYAQRGTRYAPYVVQLFEDPAFRKQLEEELYETRKKVYLEVYHTPDDRGNESKQQEALV